MALTIGKRRLALLGIAVVMAGLAGFLVKFYLDRKAAELESRYADHTEKTRVVVPKRDLPAGTRVDIAEFALRPMQTDLIPPDAVKPDEMENALGQSLKIDLPIGRPLLWSYLSSGMSPSFSDLLDKDRRALTIAVDELNSISGMVRPSDRIDLFIVGKDPLGVPGGGGKDTKIVRPLLQDVLVKATGNIVRRETGLDGKEYDRRYSTLTLDLLPDEIGKVLIAQENGELKAALKRVDQDDARYRPTRESDLWAEGNGETGGLVLYVGGKGGGALKPEILPFVGDAAAGAAADKTIEKGLPPEGAAGSADKADAPDETVVAAARTTNVTTTERAR